MEPTVALIGTLDTKGVEIAYVGDQIRALGCSILVIDSGILDEPVVDCADITREMVAAAAGTTIEALRRAATRGAAIERMREGVRQVVLERYHAGAIQGVLCLGGSEGAVMGAYAMAALPLGVPTLIVSPTASGRRPFGPLVGHRDTFILHSVVDILGINAISRVVYDNAAAAMAGMVRQAHAVTPDPGSRLVGLTMLGNTTTAVMHLLPILAARGYQGVIFHANGVGGVSMEQLIEAGMFTGVIDYTLSELAGEVAGGFHAPSQPRLVAAGRLGLPQVVVATCVDFTAHGARHMVPEALRGRASYYHNPEATLVRIDAAEMGAIGALLAERLNAARGPCTLVLPLRGFSIGGAPGGAMYDPEADARFVYSLKEQLAAHVPIVEVDAHANSRECAEVAARLFLDIAATRAEKGAR
ncbi:MAG TPA: Tm-1-like ATP-binding domain-containing protein [Chloroflexota bacterium]|nr:Tm-1-like ATP-binding domain-containing protein [Chloroflexota bacterium]